MGSKIEMIVRLIFFFGVLIGMGVWEIVTPKRHLNVSKAKRWFGNLSIVAIDSLIIRIFFPAAVIGVALWVTEKQWGIFSIWHVPFWLAVLLSVLILDFVIYMQHVMFHAVPLFWRFHRMHHVDLDFDVTTGVRFHPFEILLSLLIKFGAVLLLGAPALGVLIFQIVLNAASMFTHGNVRMPKSTDKLIRSIFVTPDMHRVHHSDIPYETNSNFGFSFSFWDRLFGTYRDQPKLGHTDMTIGLSTIRESKDCVNLLGMLKLPFEAEKHDYPINRD